MFIVKTIRECLMAALAVRGATPAMLNIVPNVVRRPGPVTPPAQSRNVVASVGRTRENVSFSIK